MLHISEALPRSEAKAFEDALLVPPPRCVRIRVDVDPAHLPFATSQVPWSPAGRWLTSPQIRPSQFLQFATGDYYIQDASSLLAIELADVQGDDRVGDLCAAPGGKASAIAERLTTGCLLAN